MQHGDAPGPGFAKQQRKLRKVAVVGAAGEQARRLQDLGEALDDAVRAARSQDQLIDGLSRRLHELWMIEREQVLEWHPTELKVGGRLVLSTSAQGGRFVLPAFHAGLRALGMREQCTVTDARRLAEQLAALEAGQLGPDAFAGWLYRGGALGFDAAQDESIFELGETLVADLNESELWSERSAQAVGLWNDLAWKAGQALDAHSLAERYRAPIARAEPRLRSGELALSEEETRALRELAEDEAAWGRAEIALMLKQPALRATLSTTHVTFRLAAVIEHSPELDQRLPELFSSLALHEAHAAAALEARIVGAAFGRRLFGRGLDPRVPIEIAGQLGPALIEGLFGYLNDRKEPCDAAVPLLRALLEQGGLRGVLARTDVVRVQPPFAAALVRAAIEQRVPFAELGPVLARLPPRSVLAALIAVPQLMRVAGTVLQRLMEERIEELEPLLPSFVRCSREAAQVAGLALVPTHGSGFTALGLEAICGAFMEVGFGRDVVIALWESRRAGIPARLAALAALQANPALLAEALKRRGPELVDPPEIRMAIEELRWRSP